MQWSFICLLIPFPSLLDCELPKGTGFVLYVYVSISTMSVARGPQQMFREEEKNKRMEGRNGRIWGKLIINPTVSRRGAKPPKEIPSSDMTLNEPRIL